MGHLTLSYVSLVVSMLLRTTTPIAPPLVRAILPNIGSCSGGQAVEIQLDNFRPCTYTTNLDTCYNCRFDSTDVYATYDMRKRRILCQAPPHKTGTVYVEVGVQSVFSFASGVMFTYEPPFLQEVYPLKGPTWGEVPITLVGANFANIDEFGNRDMHVYYKCRFFGTSFGDVTRPAQIFHSSNHPLIPTTSQLLKCIVPPSNSRCVSIEASIAGTDWDTSKTPPIPQPYIVWSQESNVSYCYQKPQISTMWPITGPIRGNTRLRMTGQNLQPADSILCSFEHSLVGQPYANGYATTTAYFQNSNSKPQFGAWTGVENDTEVLFCTTPSWDMAATVRVGLLLDGQPTSNTLQFRYEPGKMTRVTPKELPTRGGTMVTVYGVGFEKIAKPRCKFSGDHHKQKYPGHLTVTKATVVSSSVVICPSPSRLGNDQDDANHPMQHFDVAERHAQAEEQHSLRQYLGGEQVNVNAQTGNSFSLKCGPRNFASAAFHRSMMLFGDVTLESWVKLDELDYKTTGSSPIWFGLTDENLNGRFLYGIFFQTRNITGDDGSCDSWVVDVEIGHTNATTGQRYGGRYNISWPFQPSPSNLTQVFTTGLRCHQWHHIAAVRNTSAQTWSLYINATFFGAFSYGCVNCEPTPQTRDDTRHDGHRARLAAFFREYDPFMYAHIDAVLNHWKGAEEDMFQMLRSKYTAPAGVFSGRPVNLLPQDYVLEDRQFSTNHPKMSRPDYNGRTVEEEVPTTDGRADFLNAGGVDPRTRSDPFNCDSRIHGVDVCHLPWGTQGHHTVPNLFMCQGPHKHQVMNGIIEEVRVWKRARTAEEILESFDGELDGGSLDLVAYYSFNEGHGVMAFDNSTATASASEARLNMHLLGSPREMWTVTDLMSSFFDSSVNCGEACRVKYTPVPRTYYLESFHQTWKSPSLDYNSYSNVFPERFSIHPNRGPVHGGTLVTISGNDFIDSPSLGCKFTGTIPNQGGKSQGHGLVKAEWVDMNHLVCRTPASFGPSFTDVYLTNDGENFDISPVKFEYSTIIPTLHSISIEEDAHTGHAPRYCPIRTPLKGGTIVTIHGQDFMQSDSSNLLMFRMGEMPALNVVRYIDSETIVIETPPIHSRFWDQSTKASRPGSGIGSSKAPHDTHVQPEPGRPSTVNAEFGNIRNSRIEKELLKRTNPKGGPMDARFAPWGSGKPFDCSADAPGEMCYRPAFTVRVTNDGGRSWSDFPPYNTTVDNSSTPTLRSRTNCILYHDLIVDPQGNDDQGDGTYTRPFASPGKAAEWAHGKYDRIIVQAGHYSSGSLAATVQHAKNVEIIRESTDQFRENAPRITRNDRDTAGTEAWSAVGQNDLISGMRGEATYDLQESIPREDTMGMVHPGQDYHNLYNPSSNMGNLYDHQSEPMALDNDYAPRERTAYNPV